VASAVAELLANLSAALDSLGVRWYLFGAQAAILYGAARLTADVDVTVDPGAHSVAEFVEALQREKFSPRLTDLENFVERTRVLPLVHEPSRMPCDVVLAGPGIEELFLSRVQVHVVEGVTIPVASADDVVVMKVLAGRAKDLDDVVSVIRAQGSSLNVNRARETIRQLEQALDQRDLLPLLDQILDRARRAR